MKRSLCLLLFLCLGFATVFAQKSRLTGVITDADNGEALIGATVSTPNQGVITDLDGRYVLELAPGNHTITVSYVSYAAQELTVDIQGDQQLDVALVLDNVLIEVEVTADIAIERETPVAFSNIPTAKLAEELAAQDLPMILNSTPGAYATQGGGGDGDARISIRGFDQRNVAVMLDGIPVNDMENGRVFWSNWFGLDLVTQTMQVQRGLGASKLSVPSIGGTINILTNGIDAKRGLKFKQEVGSNGFLRSTFGITSGRLKSGWGISAAGSYKQGNGWVDGNFTKGYFYYLRVDKQLGNHLLSVSGFGAPQEHGQRNFPAEIGQVDTAFALEIGVPEEAINGRLVDGVRQGGLIFKNKGRRFNENWGYYNGELVNRQKNYYHKPQFNLRHSWQPNSRLFLSNVAYLSIGNGGGTDDDGVGLIRDSTDQLDFAQAVESNQRTLFNPRGLSNTILRASVNNHFWYGLLSTLKYDLRKNLTLSGGLDGRYYKGDHYREVYDLLGGTGYTQDSLQVGDHYDYDYTGYVRWFGGFALLEYKINNWSAFINASRAISGYSFRNNVSQLEIDWVNVPSTTLKLGANYNIDKHHGVFVNTGILDKAQQYRNVIITNSWTSQSDGTIANNYENEKIKAVELGYNYKSPKFALNLNGYYTIWENKPLDQLPVVPEDPSDPDSDQIPVNISGIDALHKGIELDFAYRPFKKLSIEGLASIGDWIWNSGDTVKVELPTYTYNYYFDAKGVHVGDAAQIQLGGLVRYEPIKGGYVKLNATYFAKNYAAFQPESLRGANAGRDSWQMPNYLIFDFHIGYFFKIKNIGVNVRGSMLNVADATYITDARNNDSFNSPPFFDFDAKSASAHFGQGRRGTLSLQLSF